MARVSKSHGTCIHESWHITLQHTATHCNTLQHTATHCSALQHTASMSHSTSHCNTLQHTATHCNALQHTASMSHGTHSWCMSESHISPGICVCAKKKSTHQHPSKASAGGIRQRVSFILLSSSCNCVYGQDKMKVRK